MRKKFAQNFAFLLFANLLVKPIWIFAIDRKVQLLVGAEEYGAYFTAANFSFLLSILLDLGINNFTNRAVSRTPSRASSFLSNFIQVKGLLAIAYFLLTMLIALTLRVESSILYLLAILAFNQILLSFILHFRAYIAALHFFKRDSFISILDKVLSIVFVLTTWVLFSDISKKSQLISFATAQSFALFITMLVAYYFVKKLTNETGSKWNRKYTKRILIKSLPFALLVFLMTIYGRIDGILLHLLLPENPAETGIYAAGFRLLDAATQFGFLVATILLPMFSKAFKEKTSVRSLVGFSLGLVLMASITLAVFCAYFKVEIIQLLYHTSDVRYQTVLSTLMFAFIPISSVYIFGTLLTAKGKLLHLNIIALIGIVVNVVANYVLIPRFAATGAGYAALITQIVVAILHIGVSIPILREK
jgi:O-antigen/teichoic acid export membrane protein